ncbi:MAG: hypothetical protein PHW13_06835 [Methylococcales bacterium]|nr:hypothetical protein [Methylococcales bacterium]
MPSAHSVQYAVVIAAYFFFGLFIKARAGGAVKVFLSNEAENLPQLKKQAQQEAICSGSSKLRQSPPCSSPVQRLRTAGAITITIMDTDTVIITATGLRRIMAAVPISRPLWDITLLNNLITHRRLHRQAITVMFSKCLCKDTIEVVGNHEY